MSVSTSSPAIMDVTFLSVRCDPTGRITWTFHVFRNAVAWEAGISDRLRDLATKMRRRYSQCSCYLIGMELAGYYDAHGIVDFMRLAAHKYPWLKSPDDVLLSNET